MAFLVRQCSSQAEKRMRSSSARFATNHLSPAQIPSASAWIYLPRSNFHLSFHTSTLSKLTPISSSSANVSKQVLSQTSSTRQKGSMTGRFSQFGRCLSTSFRFYTRTASSPLQFVPITSSSQVRHLFSSQTFMNCEVTFLGQSKRQTHHIWHFSLLSFWTEAPHHQVIPMCGPWE